MRLEKAIQATVNIVALSEISSLYTGALCLSQYSVQDAFALILAPAAGQNVRLELIETLRNHKMCPSVRI